jgi:hypothetical protein
LQAELQYAQSTVAVSVNLVQLYKALGGGWEAVFPARAVTIGSNKTWRQLMPETPGNQQPSGHRDSHFCLEWSRRSPSPARLTFLVSLDRPASRRA